jgi:tripartite-type tricarboxylate transporter receptor subunit TctC
MSRSIQSKGIDWRTRRLLLAVGVLCLPWPALAQSAAGFPSQPIRIVVPVAAGGTADAYARILGKAAGEILGQAVVVENKPGAGSVIGTDAVVKSKPDGHTLLLGSLPMSTNPGLMAKLPYDVQKDLRPIIHISGQGFIISVGAKQPYKSFAELIEAARQREIPYATPGIGTVGHLAGQMLNVEYGTKFIHVAYRGSAPAIQDVLAGQVPMLIDPVATSSPPIAAGQLRALAVTHPTRLATLPGTPSVRELGFPAAEGVAYAGLVAPAATPTEVITKLNAVFNQVMAQPEVRQSFERLNAPIVGGTPEAFGQLIRRESERWVPVIRKLGLKAE